MLWWILLQAIAGLGLVFAGQGCVPRRDTFRCEGLIWQTRENGVDYFYHTFISDVQHDISKSKGTLIARTPVGVNKFTHFDVDIDNATIVAVDQQRHEIIVLVELDSHFNTKWTLFEGTSDKVNGIAIDWVSDVVYWTDATYDVIMAASLHQHNRAEIVVEKGLVEPHAIVVHPFKGFMFWTDNGDRRLLVMRANLNGRHVERLYTAHGKRATTLCLDHSSDTIYWLEEDQNGIARELRSVSIFGGIVTISYDITTDVRPVGLDSFPYFDRFYFTSDRGLTVYETGKFVEKQTYTRPLRGEPRLVVAIDKQKQRPSHSSRPIYCVTCPGVCIRTNSTTDCLCNDVDRSIFTPEDDRICGPMIHSGLLVAKANGIFTMKKNFIEYKFAYRRWETYPQPLVRTDTLVRSVASDFRKNKIYFYSASGMSSSIDFVKTTEGSTSEVFSRAVGRVGGLAVDSVTHNVYWTDTEYGHIMVANQQGRYALILHAGLLSPAAIAIHPKRRLLFWSEHDGRGLCRSSLNGNEVTCEFETYQFTGITVDFDTNLVYLCDRTSVYVTDMFGERITRLYNNRHLFTGIAVYHDYLVVSDTLYTGGGLYVFDKTRVDPFRGSDQSFPFVGRAPMPGLRSGFMEFGNWYGLAYHHFSAQPDILDVCGIRKSQCDQLCIPGPKSVRENYCACEIGYIREGQRCILAPPKQDPYLFVVDQKYRKLLQVHRVDNNRFVDIPVQQLRQPYSLAFDPSKNMIYWTDLEARTISRASVDGTNQEILIYDPHTDFTDIVLDPVTRVLYYISMRADEYLHNGSITAFHVDSRQYTTPVYEQLRDPASLTLDRERGWLYFTDRDPYRDTGNIMRVGVDGTNMSSILPGIDATAVTLNNDYMYFSHKPSGYPEQTLIFRCHIEDRNISLQLALQPDPILALVADEGHLYWANTSNRGLQKAMLQEEQSLVTEQIGQKDVLFKPTDLYINIPRKFYNSRCVQEECLGICLDTPTGPLCNEKIPTYVLQWEGTDMCRVPSIQFGDIVGNVVGAIVPEGFLLTVQCYPAHRINNPTPMMCFRGSWNHMPTCKLEYSICGDVNNGYKVYNTSGVFFVYPGISSVNVLCIGGGGGGYDNKNMDPYDRAGDGGTSSFGGRLNALGGKGGTREKGGEGGQGYNNGGNGHDISDVCTTGGTAGKSQSNRKPEEPDYSNHMFCGSGGYSQPCDPGVLLARNDTFAGPGGSDGNLTHAGMYGGGSGSRGGGTGGGGGWTRKTVPVSDRELIDITVGHAGHPSYGTPGHGLVIVMWGVFQANDDMVRNHDILSTCYTLPGHG